MFCDNVLVHSLCPQTYQFNILHWMNLFALPKENYCAQKNGGMEMCVCVEITYKILVGLSMPIKSVRCYICRPIIEHLPINRHYITSNLSISQIICNRTECLVAVTLVNTFYIPYSFQSYTHSFHDLPYIPFSPLNHLIGYAKWYFGIKFALSTVFVCSPKSNWW